MSKQTSGREAKVGILPDTPRQRNVKMFDGFAKSPLWANLYRQELAKESGKPIIQMLMDENYREDIGVIFASGPKATSVKAGDKILFSTNGHQITKVNGEELVVLREKSIIAVIEGDNVQAGTYKADRQMAGIE